MRSPLGVLSESGRALVTLGPTDAGELLTLQRAAYLSEAAVHQDFELPPLTQTFDELVAELGDQRVTALGVRQQGRLIASVRLTRQDDSLDLGRLIVVPDLQGRGLGTALLLTAETVIPGTREIRLFTGEYSHANIRLYERLGYREQHRTRVGHYDLAHFSKALD